MTSNKTKKIFFEPIISSVQLQASSIDVRLGSEFLIVKIGKITHLDPLNEPEDVKREVQKYTDRYKIINQYERFILHPGEFVLGSTLEYICLPLDIAARLEGRSSWGRLGVLVHATAGYIDPGFRGHITFELKNMGKVPIPLYPGVRMAQISFFQIQGGNRGYQGKYQESFGVVPSRYFDDDEYKMIREAIRGKKFYEDKIMQIFEMAESGVPLDQGLQSENLPKNLIEAIYGAYQRKRDENQSDE